MSFIDHSPGEVKEMPDPDDVRIESGELKEEYFNPNQTGR